MNDDLNIGKLSAGLHEILMDELDFKDSNMRKYVDNQALNIVLTTLPFQSRVEFYKLLVSNDFDSAKSLIFKEIPDFHAKLLLSVKEGFEETL